MNNKLSIFFIFIAIIFLVMGIFQLEYKEAKQSGSSSRKPVELVSRTPLIFFGLYMVSLFLSILFVQTDKGSD